MWSWSSLWSCKTPYDLLNEANLETDPKLAIEMYTNAINAINSAWCESSKNANASLKQAYFWRAKWHHHNKNYTNAFKDFLEVFKLTNYQNYYKSDFNLYTLFSELLLDTIYLPELDLTNINKDELFNAFTALTVEGTKYHHSGLTFAKNCFDEQTPLYNLMYHQRLLRPCDPTRGTLKRLLDLIHQYEPNYEIPPRLYRSTCS